MSLEGWDDKRITKNDHNQREVCFSEIDETSFAINSTHTDAGILDHGDVHDDVNTETWWTQILHDMKEKYPLLAEQSVHLSQEPVLMTFSSFKRSVFNKPQVWYPLAYIDYKGNLKGKVNPVMALNEYQHQVLKTGMNWTI
jgi:hypothetical protein